jgi:hypothetical protein
LDAFAPATSGHPVRTQEDPQKTTLHPLQPCERYQQYRPISQLLSRVFPLQSSISL